MRTANLLLVSSLLLASSVAGLAQMNKTPASADPRTNRQAIDASTTNTETNMVSAEDDIPGDDDLLARDRPFHQSLNGAAATQQPAGKNTTPLDPQRERVALKVFLKSVQTQIVGVAEAMPAVHYGFAPTDGEFKGVRTFSQQVRHLSATNHILAAAALGEEPPADAGDEMGPETVRTKAELLDYLNGSFAHLAKAIDAIGEQNATVKHSPISPLHADQTTRLALTVESLIHAFNHYGQMVVYLRMVGVVPPASR